MTTAITLPLDSLSAHELYPFAWSEIEREVLRRQTLGAQQALQEFLGETVEQDVHGIEDLHHVAVYLGDYTDDRDVEIWHRFLLELKAQGTLSKVQYGPSYVAPKYYGTQGWWFSLERAEGLSVEVFCCRHHGRWSRYKPEQRYRLMSHAAVSVSTADGVERALSALTSQLGVKMLMHTVEDELGHTYGHLLNETTLCVLELVHQG
uniref:Uncharacterized protein n=1 Tax=Candidatus Kentrum sp. MB TaxID=2138164 RepID=A0A450X8T4_9GAMM|nr:MAG: hypothetical protein BECKMB1821G_GA0114241_101522 [Candidatus Kentron sp. MB]VFK29657.1 MAG: hypothetical protein BECKMB1821I_GA0114274_101121 [Candidatus Kentron sp. MB]VFK74858.1 MAG: hypothetical protein BECKMB1821H_GA0114242_101121 [Candidatus Kentron sp. MB]